MMNDHDSHPEAARARGDHGETLMEVLVAIIIIGIVISALVGGLATTLLTSAHNRDMATANVLLRSYAEGVKQYTRAGYVNCATTYDIPATAYVLPAGWSAPTNAVTPCPGGVDPGTQQVRITLVTPSSLTQTLDIWVRRS